MVVRHHTAHLSVWACERSRNVPIITTNHLSELILLATHESRIRVATESFYYYYYIFFRALSLIVYIDDS